MPFSFLEWWLVLLMEILIGRKNDTPTCYILETLRSRFGHFIANDKLRFAVMVSCYLSALIWNLSFARGCHVCFHLSTYFYFSWEIVFKITFFWNRIRQSLSNRVLKSRISSLERGLAIQTWTSNRKLEGKAPFTWRLDVRGSREMPKNLNFKVSITKPLTAAGLVQSVEHMTTGRRSKVSFPVPDQYAGFLK